MRDVDAALGDGSRRHQAGDGPRQTDPTSLTVTRRLGIDRYNEVAASIDRCLVDKEPRLVVLMAESALPELLGHLADLAYGHITRFVL